MLNVQDSVVVERKKMKRLIDLGWCMARLDSDAEEEFVHRITIVSPQFCDRGDFSPAASICVGGRDKLIALRDALNEAYPK